MSEPIKKKPQFSNKPGNFIFIIAATLTFFVIFILMSENKPDTVSLSYDQFLSYVDGVYFVKGDYKNIKAQLIEETQEKKIFIDIETKKKIELPKDVQIFPYIKVSHVIFHGPNKIEGQYELYESPESELNSKNVKAIRFVTSLPYPDPFLLKRLEERRVNIVAQSDEGGSPVIGMILNILPYILIFGLIWFLFFRQVNNSNNKAFTFAKSKARLYKAPVRKITFEDVAGVEEAKEELNEVVDFLKEPEKYLKMGARIPKGVLLVGPPGTGKTLLAKAVAGEADRPFYSISGSEFVEMFVGVGASRVRDLFETAKKDAPCILFIDELDAVGRMRGAGLGGGNDEREQTLNQILVEMDGFNNKETIIVIAATNRPDILDPALLRPGRFDRQIVVDKPDLKGREKILRIHCKNKPIEDNVQIEKMAQGTPGFSGADLENMVNEATLIAARKLKTTISMIDFEEARDKVLMGPERRSRVMTKDELTNTAYHEAGHVVVAHMLPEYDPIHKVTIIPRGRSLGTTQSLPIQDYFTHNKTYLLSRIAVLLGGRAAEEHWFGKDFISTGAASDIEHATALVRSMICKWGMSEKLGPLTYGKDDSPIFIGKEMGRYKDYSEETAREIDREAQELIFIQFEKARKILEENKEKVEILVQALLEKETLQADEILEILGERPAKE